MLHMHYEDLVNNNRHVRETWKLSKSQKAKQSIDAKFEVCQINSRFS